MADKKVYTEKEKADALKLEAKIGNRAAAEQLGISWQLLARWKRDAGVQTVKDEAKKAEDTVAATVKKARGKAKKAAEEVKETVAATEKKVRGKAKAAAEEVKETVATTAKKTRGKAKAAAEKVEEAVVAEEIEAKKTTRAAGRKAKTAVEDKKAETKAATRAKPKAKKAEYILQSAFGHELVVEEIAAKIPEDVEKVYIRIDQNKLHFVRKDGSTGSVDIW